jgi:uncharacterized protein
MTVRSRIFRAKFHKGVTQFNCGRFFEAHETWEDLWLALEGDSKRVMQGLIQAAVGAHHLQKQNRQGARSLFRNSLRKLSGGPVQFCLVDLRQLIKDLKNASTRLDSGIPMTHDKPLSLTLRTRSR